MEPSRHVLIVGTLALGTLPTGQLVVENLSTGERLGEVAATVTPFTTVLELPGEHGGTPYPVKGKGWMSPPLPYQPGMVVTVVAQDREGRELFRLEGPPIRPNADGVLRPMLGPNWVQYGPVVK